MQLTLALITWLVMPAIIALVFLSIMFRVWRRWWLAARARRDRQLDSIYNARMRRERGE